MDVEYSLKSKCLHDLMPHFSMSFLIILSISLFGLFAKKINIILHSSCLVSKVDLPRKSYII